MGKSLFSKFKNDPNREQQGVTLDLGDGVKIQVARAGGANAAFERRLAAVTKPHRKLIQTGLIDKKLADELVAQVYAETVVLGWENVTDEDGTVLDFTVDNVKKVFTALPDLFRLVRETAEDQTLFRADILEGDAGNSKRASDIN